jgi:hypothetical protein
MYPRIMDEGDVVVRCDRCSGAWHDQEKWVLCDDCETYLRDKGEQSDMDGEVGERLSRLEAQQRVEGYILLQAAEFFAEMLPLSGRRRG